MGKIRKIEKWVTIDHKEHSSEAGAEQWDSEIQKAEEATELFDTGMALAIVYQKVYGRGCPENLKMVTKDTLLTISYLQCCDFPHYAVIHFKPGGYVYVHGKRKGYQGPYGTTLTMDQVSRYYDQQLSKGQDR